MRVTKLLNTLFGQHNKIYIKSKYIYIYIYNVAPRVFDCFVLVLRVQRKRVNVRNARVYIYISFSF